MKTSLHIDSVAEAEGLLGANGTGADNRFAALMGTLLQSVMAVALLVLFFYLIWGGFDWLTSSGDKGKLEAARNKMLHAIVGILILSASIAIFMFVQNILGLEILNFDFGGGSSAIPIPADIGGATGHCVVGNNCGPGGLDLSASACSPRCGSGYICCQ